ncbi:transporter [Vibrio phage vB_VhaS_R21Y]|nr:transporter [Vibrio phage vB_VcaS_HC]WKV32864.1 transporter [Vibrio phage vB_VhaS_R21Y]
MTLHISSNISDPGLLSDLGLIGQFQLIDVAAQQEGYQPGDAILTEPNNALGDKNYSYYVQLVGQQLEISIPYEHFEAYEESSHDLGAALPPQTEACFELVHEQIEGFYAKVKSLLVNKPESPTIAALKLQNKAQTAEPTKEIKATSILHYNELLNADPKQKPVELEEAEFLYQPVNGTSANNTYFVICLTTDGLRMAARYDGCALRVRFISTWYNSETEAMIKELCNEFNFTKKTGGHYSVTFLDLNPKFAQRTLYAMLATFDPLRIRTGLPLIEEFKGA